MSGIFTFVHVVALVLFIVFLVKARKLKKAGQDNSAMKRYMFFSASAWFVALVLMLISTPPKEDEVVSDEASTSAEIVEESPADSVTEVVSESAPALSEDEYLSQLNKSLAGTLEQNEKITSVAINNRVLHISANLSKKDTSLAVSRASSITDAVLELDTSLWDKVVVDFGSVGTVTKSKDDIIKSEYGDYFDITALDGNKQAPSSATTDEQDANQFVKKYETDTVVAAKLALDNFLDSKSYDISLAPSKWNIAKFDETNTVMATTDITYKEMKMKYVYVGTLNINASGKVESAKPHYLSVGNTVLGDDGYCDEVFKKLGIK